MHAPVLFKICFGQNAQDHLTSSGILLDYLGPLCAKLNPFIINKWQNVMVLEFMAKTGHRSLGMAVDLVQGIGE